MGTQRGNPPAGAASLQRGGVSEQLARRQSSPLGVHFLGGVIYRSKSVGPRCLGGVTSPFGSPFVPLFFTRLRFSPFIVRFKLSFLCFCA